MKEKLEQALKETEAALRQRGYAARPLVGVILGSGLGALAEQTENAVVVEYGALPHFPVSSIEGHAGRLTAGEFAGRQVLFFQGRWHYYEGVSMEQLVYPVWFLKQLGARYLVVTNSSGASSPEYAPGDLVLLVDHINMLGDSPLRGPNIEFFGPRFPDMTHPYDPELLELAEQVAAELQVVVKRGVYLATTGPQYETPAEIRMMRRLGADLIGMSTVPEVIAAVHAGMRVLGISSVANLAAGMAAQKLSHEEVMEAASEAAPRLTRLLEGILKRLEE